MDFKNWFCLKDRESFTIDPKINSADARFYFGRAQLDERMKNQVKRAFIDPQVPKMMVWGPYGCGKTQTLTISRTGWSTTSPHPARATHIRCIWILKFAASPPPPSGTSKTWRPSAWPPCRAG